MAIDIKYNGNNIASLDNIKTAIIKCSGKKMIDNLIISSTNINQGNATTCSRDHVIEVDELPEVGIENALYERQGKFYKQSSGEFIDILLGYMGEGYPLFELLSMPVDPHYYYVSTRPTSNILESNPDFHFYYVEDEDNILLYVSLEEGVAPDWIPFMTLLGEDFPYPYIGRVSDATETTELGTYALCSAGGGWKEYIVPDGVLEITEPGEHDVTNNKGVVVHADNLVPLNIAEGVTILGVTGIAGTDKDGLFDNNGSQLASWNTLVDEHGLDMETDYESGSTSTTSINYILNNNSDLENATQLIVPAGVSRIGEYSVASNQKLTGVSLPDTVTQIDFRAFNECTALESVVFNESSNLEEIGSYAFNGCTNLKSITIPSSVTAVGSNAFGECAYLKEDENDVSYVGNWAVDADQFATQFVLRDDTVGIASNVFNWHDLEGAVNIPKSVKHIGYQAFSSCGGITELNFEEGSQLQTIGGWAFGHDEFTTVTLPDTVTHIGNDAFYSCNNLTNITLGSSLIHIGDRAFEQCYKLNNVIIPNTVTSIGDRAFDGCSAFTSITLPDGLTKIAESTFAGCSGLINITIPQTVTTIGGHAFGGCNSLTAIDIPEGVTSIEDSTFSSCSSLTNIDIPENVTNIGESAFSNCTGLTSITIPEGVTTIGKGALKSCTNLENITLPFIGITGLNTLFGGTGDYTYNKDHIPTSLKTVVITAGTTIGYGAFYDCGSLTSIALPDSITRIYDKAFCNCIALTSLTLPSTVTKIGFNAIAYCDALTSITFEGTVEQWNAITFDDRWNANTPATKVVCSDGEVTL